MKIVLVNPDWGIDRHKLYSRIRPSIPPLGLAYIAAALRKHGFDVVVVDQYTERTTNAKLLEKIKKLNPDIIGFSCITVSMGNTAGLVKQIRKLNGKIKIVLGNIHSSIFSERILQDNLADIVVRGEGEQTMLEISCALRGNEGLDNIPGISFIRSGRVVHNPARELVTEIDSFPYPAWDLLNINSYRSGLSFLNAVNQCFL